MGWGRGSGGGGPWRPPTIEAGGPARGHRATRKLHSGGGRAWAPGEGGGGGFQKCCAGPFVLCKDGCCHQRRQNTTFGPPARQVGQPQPKPPSRTRRPRRGGGWANGLPCHPPPPPRKAIFFPPSRPSDWQRASHARRRRPRNLFPGNSKLWNKRISNTAVMRRVLLNNSASPGVGGGGGSDTPPPPSDPPLLSDRAKFYPGLQPIKNFPWRLRRKSI